MEKIYAAIRDLTEYALATELIAEEDVIYTVNSLLGALGIDDYPGDRAEIIGGAAALDRAKIEDGTLLEGILAVILDYASEKGMIDGASVVMRDLFDTKIMGILTPRPSEVIAKFRGIYNEDPVRATDWYYDFSRNTDYIRRYRIAKDRRWKTQTEYGELDITINLSKPEKDPKAIAAARNAAQSSYPKCQLCIENEGYYGRVNHPARENHRIIPITIQGGPWGFQYSPYVYYNEHCIVFNSRHIPMAINHDTFCKLFDFIKAFPHYFLGSNADLPIVGGSILSHDHFQGGHYDFAMANAPVERSFTVKASSLLPIIFWTRGADIRMRKLSSMLLQKIRRTTRSRRSPASGEDFSNWIWSFATISLLRRIRWASIILTRNFIISKKRTSA